MSCNIKGKEITSLFLKPTNFIGHCTNFFNNSKADVTVEAILDSHIIVISKESWNMLSAKVPNWDETTSLIRNEFLEEFNFDENSSGNPSATAYFSNEKHGNVLGDYTMNMAEDEKGKYISYYDKWDLQPWKTRNKLVSSVTDLAQEVAGINPTELYGRVYY